MKKKIFSYPVEYLGEAFIHPRTLRKAELANLLDIPWKNLREDINADEEILDWLTAFRYRPMQKAFYPAQVAIIFTFYGPPLLTEKNKAIIKRIEATENSH